MAALLLAFLPNSTGVLAQRASVTLSGVAREADAPAIFSLLEHEDDTARRNLRAWLFTGGTVSRDDLRLLAYLGETHQEIELLREKVPTLLGDA